jgi:hypothetical protein
VLSHRVGCIEYTKALQKVAFDEALKRPCGKSATRIKKGLGKFMEGHRGAFPEYNENEENEMRFVYASWKKYMLCRGYDVSKIF